MKGISPHQFEILKFLMKRETEVGSLADLDQLIAGLSWNPTKESIQFSIRAMIKKCLIEKAGIQARRGRNRICFRVAFEGKAVFDPRISASPGASKLEEDSVPELI
jgi:hypothetical protein